MEKDKFLRAKSMNDAIAQTEKDLHELKNVAETKVYAIRFGNQFNVSAPIQIDENMFNKIILMLHEDKTELLKAQQAAFNLI